MGMTDKRKQKAESRKRFKLKWKRKGKKRKRKRIKKILEMRNEHKSKWVSLFGPEPILVLLPQSPSLLLGLDVWSKPSTGPSSRVAPHPSSAFVAEADTQITLGPTILVGMGRPFPSGPFCKDFMVLGSIAA